MNWYNGSFKLCGCSGKTKCTCTLKFSDFFLNLRSAMYDINGNGNTTHTIRKHIQIIRNAAGASVTVNGDPQRIIEVA